MTFFPINKMNLEHGLFIIDAQLVNTLNFADRKKITENLVNALLNTLKMEKLGPLEIYDAIDDTYPGWSFIQPITTSHISGHYFEDIVKPSNIHIDIYSCKKFKWESVIEVLNEHLHLSKWIANFIDRSDDIDRRNVLLLQGNGNTYKTRH